MSSEQTAWGWSVTWTHRSPQHRCFRLSDAAEGCPELERRGPLIGECNAYLTKTKPYGSMYLVQGGKAGVLTSVHPFTAVVKEISQTARRWAIHQSRKLAKMRVVITTMIQSNDT